MFFANVQNRKNIQIDLVSEKANLLYLVVVRIVDYFGKSSKKWLSSNIRLFEKSI